MVTTGNDKPFQNGMESGTSQDGRAETNDDRHAAANNGAQENAKAGAQPEVADNSVLLDEIETLLHELSTEFSAMEDGSGKPSAKPQQDLPQDPSMLAGNAANPVYSEQPSFDLGKPIDYPSNPSDPSQYDYRRAGESYQSEAEVRTMARKLAPIQEQEPAASHRNELADSGRAGAQTSAAMSGAAASNLTFDIAQADAATSDDKPEGDKWTHRKRRLRLRPARRVPGSRPEAQFSSYGTASQMPDSEWDPRLARISKAQRGYGVALGAGLTVLAIAGTTGAFALIEPLNRLLPVNVASVFSPAPEDPADLDVGYTGRIEVAELTNPAVADDSSGPQAADAKTEPLGTADDSAQKGGQAATTEIAATPAPVAETPEPAAAPRQVALAEIQPAASTSEIAEPARIEPVQAEVNPAAAIRNEPVETEPFRTASGESAIAGGDKTAERINQDTIVQAILKDPKKRALESVEKQQETELANVDAGSDGVITGAISNPTAEDRILGASTAAEQASSDVPEVDGRVAKRTLASNQTVKIAGLSPNTPFGTIREADDTTSQAIEPPATPPAEVKKSPPANTVISSIDPNDAGLGGPTAPTVHGTGVESLLKRGHELLLQGDIATARLLFRRVVAMGDGRGAQGMGMTYDPKVYVKLPVAGLAPDPALAEAWYLKAKELSEVKPAPDATATGTMSVSGN